MPAPLPLLGDFLLHASFDVRITCRIHAAPAVERPGAKLRGRPAPPHMLKHAIRLMRHTFGTSLCMHYGLYVHMWHFPQPCAPPPKFQIIAFFFCRTLPAVLCAVPMVRPHMYGGLLLSAVCVVWCCVCGVVLCQLGPAGVMPAEWCRVLGCCRGSRNAPMFLARSAATDLAHDNICKAPPARSAHPGWPQQQHAPPRAYDMVRLGRQHGGWLELGSSCAHQHMRSMY